MSQMQVSKRVHLIPMGYEKDRITVPALEYNADEAILLEPSTDEKGVHRPAYHDNIRDMLQEGGVDVETVECDIFNLYESLGTVAQLANEFSEHHVYVNLASGSKVTAIGGMIACMATGATPYYVRAQEYAGGDETPVAEGVKNIEMLPKYHIEAPERQNIEILSYIKESDGTLTKHDLIEFGKQNELPFISRYDTDGVNNPDRGYYRRLNTQVISPLADAGFINVEKHSKYQYVTITESGENQLQAFRYLLSK
jgi:hypothetical protein